MRVVVAPDSFGGTLSAVEAAAAIAAGWSRYAPGDEVVTHPLADGGPGFVDVLSAALPGDLVPITVPDPLGRDVTGSVLRVGEVGYVESAQACGLHLLAPEERDVRRTTSYGVGVLIAAAVETGARRVVVGLGGSATNDGGAGMLTAVGVTPLGPGTAALPYGGAALLGLDRLVGAPRLRQVELVIAADVDNPLTGPAGASAVYGPQKGASPEDIALLDHALTRFAEVAVRDLPTAPADLASLPGGGAAGGLGAGLLALGARRESGIELVRRLTGLDRALSDADLVITGEGSYDAQSARGKVAAGVAGAAAERGVPCVVVAGQVRVEPADLTAAGLRAVYSVAEHAGSVSEAMAEPAARLADLACDIARDWSPRR